MRSFPEPQYFICCSIQNWDLRPSEEGPRQTLLKLFLTQFQNIGFVAPGFEGSKFLRKC